MSSDSPNSSGTPYMQQLLARPDHYQTAIEDLLAAYQVEPVGGGYIDLIVARDRAVELVQDLARLPVATTGATWWCHCTDESRLRLGCPHGYGGPLNSFGEGWFSECVQYRPFDVTEHGIHLDDPLADPHTLAEECSRIFCDYMEHDFMKEPFYSPCLRPGLWLHVPDEWWRLTYDPGRRP